MDTKFLLYYWETENFLRLGIDNLDGDYRRLLSIRLGAPQFCNSFDLTFINRSHTPRGHITDQYKVINDREETVVGRINIFSRIESRTDFDFSITHLTTGEMIAIGYVEKEFQIKAYLPYMVQAERWRSLTALYTDKRKIFRWL